MDNKTYFNQIKPFYNSLKFFDIKDNYLILNSKQTFILPLIHTNLSQFNKDIFLASPGEIFHILQINELLYKEQLSENEKKYIIDFTQKYLDLKKQNNEENNINTITLWCLEIIISKAFQEEFVNNPASKEITMLIDNNTKDFENGRNTGVKLVLSKGNNQNFEIIEDFDSVKTFEKAGFTTLFLVIITVILTCIFITFFILNN